MNEAINQSQATILFNNLGKVECHERKVHNKMDEYHGEPVKDYYCQIDGQTIYFDVVCDDRGHDSYAIFICDIDGEFSTCLQGKYTRQELNTLLSFKPDNWITI